MSCYLNKNNQALHIRVVVMFSVCTETTFLGGVASEIVTTQRTRSSYVCVLFEMLINLYYFLTFIQSIGVLEKLQEQLEHLSTKQHALEMEMSSDPIKQEAVKMYENLHELNQKKEQLEQEERARVSPEQEQQQLLSDVKMHNQDISALDRQNKELEESINRLQEELQDAEGALEDQEVSCMGTLMHITFFLSVENLFF